MNRVIWHILSGKTGACLELQILMRQTAKAFGADVPKTAGLSAAKLLRAYAQFTADESVHFIESGKNPEEMHQELYQMACGLGSRLRWWLRPKNAQDCFAVISLLYRNIGIQISEETPGTVCVQKCYFRDFYTPEICSVISAIDQGIFAGIYQGGKLAFRERMTEGHDVCRADFG